jgi:hypothetical protein
MTSKHEEFPPLTHQAKCVLMNTFKGIDLSTPNWDRRFAAAVIREAMVQFGAWTINSDFPRVIEAKDLDAIADNLHALPPEPPLKKRALDIWGQVEGEVSDHEAQIMRTALALIPEPIPCQGLGRQDLQIRDCSNLAAIVDRAERVLHNSITNTSIDVGCVLRSLIGEIRNELGLPKPSEAA